MIFFLINGFVFFLLLIVLELFRDPLNVTVTPNLSNAAIEREWLHFDKDRAGESDSSLYITVEQSSRRRHGSLMLSAALYSLDWLFCDTVHRRWFQI